MVRRVLTAVLVAAGFAATPSSAFAFPELVRHNYVNCTSCHVNPSGAGVLTKYGRDLSRAVLSTWGTQNENEAKFAYGVVNTPDWLDLAAFYRGVYTYRSTPFIQQGRYIFMQGDAEAAAHIGKFDFDFTLGYQDPATATSFTDHVILRRHYVTFKATDNLLLRGGRFYPNFGINTPDHVIPTKRDIGWDENRETYNLEAAWLGESLNVFVDANFGRPDQPSLNRDTGVVVTPSIAIADHYKIGASYFYANGPTTPRHVFGPWGILGFTPHFFMLTEWDFQQLQGGTWGAVNYQRLDYEAIQGLHFYVTQDYSKLDFSDGNTLRNSFGAGIQWFPRPHFEFNLSWQKLRNVALTSDYTDFAWFMVNVYL